MFKTATFLLVICTIIFQVNSLECYTCYDCANSGGEVTSCDTLLPTSTTSSTSTSTTSTTTSPTTTTSTTPSTSTETTNTSTITASTKSTTTSTTTPTTTTSTESTTTSTTTPTNTSRIESTTTTNTTTTTEAPFVEEAERADISFECFSGIIRENNTDIIVRGCAAGRTNETCETFGLTSCTFCSTDKCNAAGSVQVSVAVLLVVLIITYVLKN